MSDMWSHSNDWDNGYAKGHKDGYNQGRADKYQEITSEYMLLTEKQVAEIRADAIDELLQAIIEKSNINEEDYAFGEFARVCIWQDDLQKIEEQLKEKNNEH